MKINILKCLLMKLTKKEESSYCKVCGSCGHDGCCSALKCAYANMVLHPHPDCDYGENYYLDIEFAYKMFAKLYEKYPDKEMFDEVWNTVYTEKENDH